jgi:hypothetical protein
MAMVLPGLFAAMADGFMAKVIPLSFCISTNDSRLDRNRGSK